MFRETEGKKVVEKYCLSAAPIDANEVNMDFQKGYGDKDISGNFPVRILPFQ